MSEALDYLQQPGFARLWTLLRDKYERLGRIGGKVDVAALTPSENEALSGLLAINLYGETACSIRLQDLDAALQRSRLQMSLLDCLQLLFPDLLTKQQQTEQADVEWQQFFEWATKQSRCKAVTEWTSRLHAHSAPGYRPYLDCFSEYLESGSSQGLVRAIRALEVLFSRRADTDGVTTVVRLPIFAAETTGDPHGLDRDTLAGRLFYSGLLSLFGNAEDVPLDDSEDNPGNSDDSTQTSGTDAPSEQLRMIYGRAGILLDDISSIVWVGNWPGFYTAPVAVTLMTLERYFERLPAVPAVYVVENPSVFAALMEESPPGAPIICTSGQPSTAALRLLDMAAAFVDNMNYSGDFDVKGLQMMAALRKRYGARLLPWRMDRAAYVSVCNAARDVDLPGLSDAEVDALRRLDVDWDEELVGEMVVTRRKVFQEHLLRELVKDISTDE